MYKFRFALRNCIKISLPSTSAEHSSIFNPVQGLPPHRGFIDSVRDFCPFSQGENFPHSQSTVAVIKRIFKGILIWLYR